VVLIIREESRGWERRADLILTISKHFLFCFLNLFHGVLQLERHRRRLGVRGRESDTERERERERRLTCIAFILIRKSLLV
jgi:hypothetical protein